MAQNLATLTQCECEARMEQLLDILAGDPDGAQALAYIARTADCEETVVKSLALFAWLAQHRRQLIRVGTTEGGGNDETH